MTKRQLIKTIWDRALYVRRGQGFYNYLNFAPIEKLEVILEEIETQISNKGLSSIPVYSSTLNITRGWQYQSVREHTDYLNTQEQWL